MLDRGVRAAPKPRGFDMKASSAAGRIRLGLSMMALGLLGLIAIDRIEARQQSNFMGGSPSVENSDDVRTLRLLFPAGVRSNWHSHTDGQLLMIEEGLGRHQVRGGPLQEMRPGEPWWTPTGVEHWHGAAPDQDSHQLTIYSGTVTWLEPVPDEVYLAEPSRR